MLRCVWWDGVTWSVRVASRCVVNNAGMCKATAQQFRAIFINRPQPKSMPTGGFEPPPLLKPYDGYSIVPYGIRGWRSDSHDPRGYSVSPFSFTLSGRF